MSLLWILIVSLVLCIAILYCITTPYISEGFFDVSTDYADLQTRLSTIMSPYCELAAYAQSQMRIIYTAIGESQTQVELHIQQTYKDVYACKDDAASSRPSCSLGSPGVSDPNLGFIPCDTYLSLPAWSSSDNGQAAAIALSAIPDDLQTRITKELDWYSQIITKLQSVLDSGNNPPTTLPNSETSPSTDSSGKAWSSSPQGFSNYRPVEGFATCSPSQAQAQVQARLEAQAQAQAGSCTMPTSNSQIARVNAILDSPGLQAAIAKCAALKVAMVKLQSDQQKAKDGTLYAWQNDGPTKTYKTFPTGDRKTNFLSSIQQNQ